MQWQWGNGRYHKYILNPAERLSELSDHRDRLSALPDDILCNHILTRLPLKLAIKCSILSRRWSCLWTRLPSLNFPRQFFRSVASNRKAKMIIKKLLLAGSVQLDSFELEVDKSDFDYIWERKLCNKIAECIDIAASRKVKKIALKNTYSSCSVPSNLFTCDRLVVLCLQNFEISSIPTNFSRFPCLMTCSLQAMLLNDGILEQLIAACPRLESLTLSGCEGLTDLKICSPILGYLNIGIGVGINPDNIDLNSPYCLIPNSITLKCPQLDTLVLETNSVFKRRPEFYQIINAIYDLGVEINVPICRRLCTNLPCVNILNSFPSLEELSMDTYCFHDTVNGRVSILTNPLEKLKKVHVSISVFDGYRE
ncbi:hypothetical protein SUGI_1059820 [Cryptomeria japonica]|nr:hypothetical protein SUGI_1059820 [Cryptomeria japonica]